MVVMVETLMPRTPEYEVPGVLLGPLAPIPRVVSRQAFILTKLSF